MTKILDVVNGEYIKFVKYEKSPFAKYYNTEQYLYLMCKVSLYSKYYNRDISEFEIIP